GRDRDPWRAQASVGQVGTRRIQSSGFTLKRTRAGCIQGCGAGLVLHGGTTDSLGNLAFQGRRAGLAGRGGRTPPLHPVIVWTLIGHRLTQERAVFPGASCSAPISLTDQCALPVWPGVRRAGLPRQSPALTPGQRRREAPP